MTVPDILCKAAFRNSRGGSHQEIPALGGVQPPSRAGSGLHGRLRSVLGVLAGLLMIVGTTASAEMPTEVLRMFRSGKLRRAHRKVLDGLETRPDDPELHAAYAAILQKGGRFAESLVAFEFAKGSEWYESQGIPFHATALARVGRSEESVVLRSEFELAGGRKPAASLGVRTSQVEDHILGGRPELAVEVAEAAVEQFPASPVAFAALTEALTAAGRVDEAGWALIRGESLGASGSTSVRMARMRWHIGMEDYAAAWDISEEFRAKRHMDFRLWADRARIRRLQGDAHACLTIINLPRFEWGLAPEMALEGSRCAEILGDRDGAVLFVEKLVAGYGDHPEVAARMAELGITK